MHDVQINPKNKVINIERESNYVLWTFRIQTILERKDLWEFVESKESTSSSFGVIATILLNPRDVDTIKRSKTKKLSIIKLAIKDQIFFYILNVKIQRIVGTYFKFVLKFLTTPRCL
jgi:hypothetical protein